MGGYKKARANFVGVIVEGFLVPHAHVHLVPLNAGSELNPENALPADKEKLEQVADKIKREMD